MTDEYLRTLKVALINNNIKDTDDILSYYEELILDMKNEGVEDQIIIEKLGDPVKIANDLKVDRVVKQATKDKTIKTNYMALMLVLGTLSFPIWFPIIIGLIAVLITLLMVIFAVFISLAALAIAGVTIIGYLIKSTVTGEIGAAELIYFLGCTLVVIGLSITGIKLIIKLVGHVINMFVKLFMKIGRKGNKNEAYRS